MCWPLALLAWMVWPLDGLISNPLRLIGIGIGAGLSLIGTIYMYPLD
jgi:hypothetical protein